jgi:8-oxo-dGTP pyrophosphatase MutT (NUDIX family)
MVASCSSKRKPSTVSAYNQPAGHLECGESLLDAVIRETLEETAYTLNPQYLIGVYNYRNEARDVTYLRFAFGGEISAHDPGGRSTTASWRRTG